MVTVVFLPPVAHNGFRGFNVATEIGHAVALGETGLESTWQIELIRTTLFPSHHRPWSSSNEFLNSLFRVMPQGLLIQEEHLPLIPKAN